MSKSIIGLVLSIAALAILLTGCSDEPDPNPSDGTDSSTTTSSEQGGSLEPTHAPTSAVTNIAASEAATPTPAALPTATATSATTATAAAAETRSAGEFASVSAGVAHTCGVRNDGSVECWGLNEDDDGNVIGQATPPSGEFISVSAGGAHTCGVRNDGSVECWGLNEDAKGNFVGQATPPLGEFASVSAGGYHTCGVRNDGSVECWGYNEDAKGNFVGQATPPGDSFASVSAGGIHTCGLRSDGSVDCWGFNEDGQATPPSGSFVSVNAGVEHTCGVKSDGSVECWGRNADPVGSAVGPASPPSGSFVSVSAGGIHTCGVRTDSSVECWGFKIDDWGPASPPSGSFTSVSAGWVHTCGVRNDGSVECWGNNDFGQANPNGADSSTTASSEQGGPFFDLMKLIPLTEDSRSIVSFNDYGLAREANGIQAPAEDASDQDLEEYLRELGSTGLAAGPWISGFTRESMAQLEQKYLGFGVGDVERSILAGEPPYTLEAVSGRFDPETTGASLAACAECDKPEVQEHLGVKFYSWGEDYKPDLKKRLQPPAYDVLGRGGRIAVLDSVVFRTLGTAGMRSLIRTYGGNGDSLADDPDLALAAGALQNLGVYSALLAGDVERFTDPLGSLLSPEERAQLQKMRDQLQMEAGTTSEKYSVLGAGVAKDSDGFVTILVFVYEDEGAASRNVQDFEERLANGRSMLTGQPWTEYFPEGEVWNDGRALIARLPTERPRIWEQMVLSVDSLLWQE